MAACLVFNEPKRACYPAAHRAQLANSSSIESKYLMFAYKVVSGSAPMCSYFLLDVLLCHPYTALTCPCCGVPWPFPCFISHFDTNTSWFCPFLAGCVFRQHPLWTHITEAVLGCLQRLGDTLKMNSHVLLVTLFSLRLYILPKAKLLKSSHSHWWASCRSTTWVSITVITAASPPLHVLKWLYGLCMKSPSTSRGPKYVP